MVGPSGYCLCGDCVLDISGHSEDRRTTNEDESATLCQTCMNRLCIFIGMTVFGWIGWWVGEQFGFMTAFIVSGIGSMLGVYVGWRINRDYLG